MTYNLRQIMLQKRKAFKKFQKSGLRVDKLQYIQLKNVFSTAIKNEKRAYYSYHVHKSFNNSRQLWNNVRKWKIISKAKQEIPDYLTPDLINSNLLCSIPQFDIDSNTLQYYSNNSYPVDENFKFRLATRDEVLDIINSIKTNAEGVDGISIQIIKYCLPYCLDPLTNIVNYSLETGNFPTVWKNAFVVPIPKCNTPSVNDLRPISTLTAPSKALEREVFKQISEYVESNNILPKFQSGFRKGHSCESALCKITNDITKGFDNGKCTAMVLIDMTKAFDSLNIELLLTKLSFYNTKGTELHWFSNYLCNRYQAVKFNRPGTELSEFKINKTGVPQGSILGPLLFSLYIADISSVIKYTSWHMYADDLQLYTIFDLSDALSAKIAIDIDLDRIIKYTTANSLKINPIKSQAILFGKSDVPISPFEIIIDGHAIEWTNEVKNLGLIMDKKCYFTAHVNKTCRTAFIALKNISEFANVLPVSLKIILSESLVLSHLKYMDIVYGSYLSQKDKYKLQKIQNACLRFIYLLRKFDHISEYRRKVEWLTMNQRRFVHFSCFIYKVIKP
nr:unnamed protein product [Callosobruchus analis]